MKVVIGSDHAGFALKEVIKTYLVKQGLDVTDVGTNSTVSVDYPDIARAVGETVAVGNAERGILICGSGVGASIAANKVRGVRAAICHDAYSAAQGVEHDDMNVLTLGGRVIGEELARSLVDAFLEASFSNEERHLRRLRKVLAIEAQYGREGANE
jgi:RpiB/LacA/LacB family sugar-phosphate isomerase